MADKIFTNEELMNDPRIFVFGSNLAGAHGAGAARQAAEVKGARYGIGVGPYGESYAIPTKDQHIETMELRHIKPYVDQFIIYATEHPEKRFFVTKIGCGLAGLKEHQIAPMFMSAPENCDLPEGWR